MSKEIKVFELKRDMIPIVIIHRDCDRGIGHNAGFRSPVCVYVEEVMERCGTKRIYEGAVQIRKNINDDILSYQEPFDRFEGLYDLNERDTIWDNHFIFGEGRGVTGLFVGRSVNSGDIYSTDEGIGYFGNAPNYLEKYFHEGYTWFCHNVDNYYQAVVAREYTVEWFNYIMEKANEIGVYEPLGR